MRPDRARDAIDGSIQIEQMSWRMQVIEARTQERLRVIWFAEAANRKQSADGARQLELVLESLDGRGMRLVGKQPAGFRANVRSRRHAGKLCCRTRGGRWMVRDDRTNGRLLRSAYHSGA